MGDRSPKSVHKKATQKQSKANTANEKKRQAIAAISEGHMHALIVHRRKCPAKLRLKPTSLTWRYLARSIAQEVANADDIPLGTAKTRIRSAMIKLRIALEAEEARS